LLGQVPEVPPQPRELVARLGSPRYAEREAAAAGLEQLGGAALPALRAARDSRDLEIRTRAYHLIDRIEAARLMQPSRVRLGFENVPLADALKSLSEQAGFKIAVYPENVPRWSAQRVTLRESDPVPFWRAIDRLCDVAGLQADPRMHGSGMMREPVFFLSDGTGRALVPVSDHGPFRVSLSSVHYQRDVNFVAVGLGAALRSRPGMVAPRRAPAGSVARPQLNPVTNEQFTAQLVVAAEPRLSISQNGVVQVLEAVDNLGKSLAPAGAAGPVINRFATYFGGMNGSVLQVQATLVRPSGVGETIKKLRGVVPLAVSSRRPEPLIASLDHATGKRFENRDVELTIHDIRLLPNTHQAMIELSVKPNEHASSSERGAVEAWSDLTHRVDSQRLQLEILDARGQSLAWFPSGVDSETSHVTLTVSNVQPTATLKELRYHMLTRDTMSVPFEFNDIPMP
jgi:hypothetical protein